MKSLKGFFFFTLMALSLLSSKAQRPENYNQAGIFNAKFTRDQVWDVQRDPAYPVAGQDWTLSGLKDALDASGANIQWGAGRYLMLVAEADNSNGNNSLTDEGNRHGARQNVALKLFENNGRLVKVVSKWGKIIGLGEQGFMYEEEGMYGTFFSAIPVNKNTVIRYKPNFATVTRMSELGGGSAAPKSDPIPESSTNRPGNYNQAGIFNAKFTRDQVWDVQRDPAYPVAGQDWKLSGLQDALDASRAKIQWGVGRYLMLVAEADNSNGRNSLSDEENRNGPRQNVALKLFESNGQLVKIISRWGKIIGMGEQGFMYEEEGKIGTFFSAIPVNKNDIIRYKPNFATVTRMSELGRGSVPPGDNVMPAPQRMNNESSPASIAIGFYTITSQCSGKVLDVLDASKLDGARIQQWKLNGNVAQHWKIEPVPGAPGYYTLTSRCSGKVLDVLDASKLDGAKIQQWKRNGNFAQHWKIDPVAGASGYFILTSRSSGKVLDVLDASTSDGAIIQQWKLNGNNAQHWKLDLLR